MRMMSNRPVFQAATAAAPSGTISRAHPTEAMTAVRTCWLVTLSSAASTRRGEASASSSNRPSSNSIASPAVARSRGAENRKVVPRPSVLSKAMRPPIIWASSAEMARPRPVPPKRRVAELSTWTNFSNSTACFSAGMPTPVSRTVMTSWSETWSKSTVIEPEWVNFTALETRLPRIWRSRPGSPRQPPFAPGMVRITNSRPFSVAEGAKRSCTGDRAASRSKSSSDRVRRPASILDRSRTSLRMLSSRPPDWRTTSRRFLCSTGRSPMAMISAMVRTPFRGVRISWLILARNCDFIRLASLARSRASCSSATMDCCWASRTDRRCSSWLKAELRPRNRPSRLARWIGS